MYFFIALSTLSSLLFTFIITRKWSEPLDKKEPGERGEYETFKYLIGWYVLKTYTKINMYIKKISKIRHYFYGVNDTIDIHFISNGEEILKISNNDSDLRKIKTYDFIFYEFDKEDEPNYMVIRDVVPAKVEEVEKINIGFLAPQIIIDKVQTIIEFSQNIYLVGNKLFSRPFIKWYMKTVKNYLLEDNKDYSIKFFDNNMDFIEINSEQCIILQKDSYEIVKYERASASASEAETEASSASEAEAASASEAEAEASSASEAEASSASEAEAASASASEAEAETDASSASEAESETDTETCLDENSSASEAEAASASETASNAEQKRQAMKEELLYIVKNQFC